MDRELDVAERDTNSCLLPLLFFPTSSPSVTQLLLPVLHCVQVVALEGVLRQAYKIFSIQNKAKLHNRENGLLVPHDEVLMLCLSSCHRSLFTSPSKPEK